MNFLILSSRQIVRRVAASNIPQWSGVQRHPPFVALSTRLLSSSTAHEEEEQWESSPEESKDSWMTTFNELKNHLEELRKERGSSESDPAPFPTEKHLINWVSKMRFYYKNGRFGNEPEDEDRIDMLESIGVAIDPYSTKWEFRFQKLEEFIEKHGCFPYEIEYDKLDEEGKRVLEWTRRQKSLYRAHQSGVQCTTMTEERIKKLEEIGFSWNKYEEIWMQRYNELVDFYEHHGHSLVPTDYPANQTLANWVGDQRSLYRLLEKGLNHSLSEERLALLAKVEFQWDARQAKWDAKYSELAEHVRLNGLGSIPDIRKNRLLCYWVYSQRKQYKKMMRGESTPLDGKRKELLDKLGFPWPSDW